MAGTCSSKRTGLVVGVIGSILLCGVAVIFYFIGANSSSCEKEIVPTKSTFYFNTSKSYTSPLMSKNDGRLPRSIVPILYKVELFPYIYGNDSALFYFTGSVEMTFVCKERSQKITMNLNKLNITDETIYVQNIENGAIDILFFEIDTQWQFLIIHLEEFLTPNATYVVGMEFKGSLKTDYAGLYLSSFKLRTSNRYVAATQFSPTDARKAFPCLDEPDFKAQFDITIVRRDDMISLSNMPKVETKRRGTTFVADVYQRTPRMSTYLVAMVVGDFASETRLARQGLNYTSWAGFETINKTEQVLTFGANVLSFFEEYFGTTFPLPKQDILAVPETAVGAMENWGLIIFNEKGILYEEGEYSLFNLKESFTTMSHELAHQWFGNLVTQKWWSDLFLKEGFAVYFGEVGINHFYPEWNVLDQFAARTMHSVFDVDALVTSHPVHKRLRDVTEIRQVFDQISYDKGGCMIRMLKFILGENDFRAGLKRYIQRFKYENVGYDDLWSEIEPRHLNYFHPPGIKAVMDTWILQKNYPVVTIRQPKPSLLEFKQERFLNNPTGAANDTDISPFGYVWKLPLTYTTSTKPRFEVTNKDILWMEDKVLMLIDRELENLTASGNWIIANLKQWGYYRVNYEDKIWTNLIDQLERNHTVIDKVNRAQIINDLFSLSKAKLVPLKTSLTVFDYLKDEEEYIPWIPAFSQIYFIDKLMKNSAAHAQFRTLMKFIIRPRYAFLQANKDNLTVEQHWMRAQMYALASTMNMQTCLKDSQQKFEQWTNYGTKMDVNIRLTAVCSALKNGSMSDWNFVLEQFNKTTNVNERLDYLQALTCPNDQQLIDTLLERTRDTFTMTGRDVVTALKVLAQNSDTDIAWIYVKQNWQHFLDAFSDSLFLLNQLVKGVTHPFTTVEQLRDLEDFIAKTPDLGTAAQAFTQAVEATRANIDWLRDNQVTVEDWVKESLLKIQTT